MADPQPVVVPRADAGTGEWSAVGPVRVRVAGVKIGKVAYHQLNTPATSATELLQVELAAETTAKTGAFHFRSWGRQRGALGVEPTMMDDRKRVYPPVRFGSECDVPGMSKADSVRPDRPTKDLVLFDSPHPSAEYMDLDLPAELPGYPNAAFRFRIPKAAWAG